MIKERTARKMAREKMVARLREGKTYGRGKDFFHPTKSELKDKKHPSRYKEKK